MVLALLKGGVGFVQEGHMAVVGLDKWELYT